MQERLGQGLWRKTVNMLREHPALCLPLVCASLLDFYQEWLQKVLAREAVNWFMAAHSVLGFSFPPSERSFELVKRALLFALPLSLGLRLLVFCAYVIGFLLTARMVRAVLLEERPNWTCEAILVRSRLWQVLLFSTKLFVMLILGITLASGLLNLEKLAFLRSDFPFPVLVEGMTLLMFVCVAWILTPASLRLIADRQVQIVQSERKMQARIAAILVGVVIIVLLHFIREATPSIRFRFESDAWLRSFVIWPGITILGDLPQVLLWVFMGLLVHKDLEMAEIPSPS